MDIKETQKRILKAVREARKLMEDPTTDDSGIGTDGGSAVIGVDATGEQPEGSKINPPATLNTASKETSLFRGKKGKLKEKKAEVKPGKAVIPLKSGEKVPDGFVAPQKDAGVAINIDAITNLDKFISDKHEAENS